MFQPTVSAGGVGPLPWVHRFRQAPASSGALHGVTNSGTSGYSSMGSPMGWVWISPPPWPSMSCRGAAFLTKPHRAECYTMGELSDDWLW